MPLLFDRRCILCGDVLSADTCRAEICPDCAREVRSEYRFHGEIHIPGADGAAAALVYRGRVREALRRFKFGGRANYASWFAAEMALVLSQYLDEWRPTCVTYLPLGPMRARERGYNQAELLAQPVAEAFSLPCTPLLRKRLFAGRQSSRTGSERQESAAGSLLPGRGASVDGGRILVIDDIITTGSTAGETVRVLKSMGAESVFVLSAAKTTL